MTDLAPLLAQLRDELDPEQRSRALQEIALADRTPADPRLLHALLAALGDDDPVVQEWATVALRRYKGDADAIRALRECFEDEQERENIRCCAVVGLGCVGEWLSGDRLRQLYRERRTRQDDLLFGFAIHWAGRNATDPEVLEALLDLLAAERERRAATPQCETIISTAALRCARGCLVQGTIARRWLEERGCTELLDKLGETRMQRLLEAEQARRSQITIPGVPESVVDTPLVPGRTLADVHEAQYVQDLAEWRNVKLRETRSYVRDQFLARQAKKAAGYACEVCRDHLASPGLAARFVHAHHIEPLSERGGDVMGNLIVLCPNCHARVHAREITITVTENGDRSIRVGNEPPRVLPLPGAGADPRAVRQAAAHEQIMLLLQRLARDRLQAVRVAVDERLREPVGGRESG